MRVLLCALAISAFSALASQQAHAEDFEFTVPVRIENMRHITGASVTCGLEGYRGTRTLPVGSTFSYTPVPIVDGAYTGSITVRITLPTGVARSDFPRWQCGLMYSWPRPAGATGGYSTGDEHELYAIETTQVVARSSVQARGDVPR
jgi:hypothetical protein